MVLIQIEANLIATSDSTSNAGIRMMLAASMVGEAQPPLSPTSPKPLPKSAPTKTIDLGPVSLQPFRSE